MTRRFLLPALLGVLLGSGLCAGLIWADNAGAQEDTTTTSTQPAPTTTTPPTTTTTAPPTPAPDHADPLGNAEATAWLARLIAFAVGVVIAR